MDLFSSLISMSVCLIEFKATVEPWRRYELYEFFFLNFFIILR